MKTMYRFRIFYIGSGYEAVHTDIVYAYTYGQALDLAELNYKNNNWTFHYCEIEAKEQCKVNYSDIFANLETAYGESTQSDNAFARAISQIKWDNKFYADGEHYFLLGDFSFSTPSLDPFGSDMEWKPSAMFPDGSIISF